MVQEKIVSIPSPDHVVRHVPWARLRKDENDVVLGCQWTAFQLRPGEDGLSVSWLEYYSGTRHERLVQMAAHQTLKIGSKSRFALGNVGEIHQIFRDAGHKVRVVHEAVPGNPAHALIRQMPPEDQQLLDLLASAAFAELFEPASLLLTPD